MPPPAIAPLAACVVTFNPDAQVLENLRQLRRQIADVVVVDNGSVNAPAVERWARETACAFIANASNRGIATALNQGVQWARGRGAAWVGTYDQDSLLSDGVIDGLFSRLHQRADADRVGILTPTHQDRVTGRHYHHTLDILEEAPGWRRLRTTITSGCLVRLEAIECAGNFDESLFIDFVDHDFCLRLRRRGWSILEDRQQVLTHALGAATEHRILGFVRVCTNHSALRRYYMARNQLEVIRRNLLVDPVWSVKSAVQLVSAMAGVLLFEEQAGAKLMAMGRGALHFLLRRFGPYH